MTNPYPSSQPKRLERSKSNRMLAGVCGGVANYLNMDANLVRVLTVLISLFTGVPIVVYIVLAFVLPEEGSESAPSYPPVGGAESQQSAAGSWNQPTYAPQPSPGPVPTMAAEPVTDPVWGAAGAPWEQQAATRPAATEPMTTAGSQPMGEQSQPSAQPTDQQTAGGSAAASAGEPQPQSAGERTAGESEATIPITTEPGDASAAPNQEPGRTA